jgi:hypothetical protein
MQLCLLCQSIKPNRDFDPDRASCRACLGRFDRKYGPPTDSEYRPFIEYAKRQWWRNRSEAEAIAWAEIAEAKRIFDPPQGMTLDAYTRLRIHNAIANARRKGKHFIPWTDLNPTMERPGKEPREIPIEQVPATTEPALALVSEEAVRRVRAWLLWCELFGEPVTFEGAKAHFGQHDPTIGNEKSFGWAMKGLGYGRGHHRSVLHCGSHRGTHRETGLRGRVRSTFWPG